MSERLSYLDRLLDPFANCLTPEVAAQLLDVQPDPVVQARISVLAEKANRGTLTSEERDEYEEFIEASDLLGILRAKARNIANRSSR